MASRPFTYFARVALHLDAGFTRLAVYPPPDASGEPVGSFDIPTALIPVRLRRIGSRLKVSGEHPDPHAPVEEIRLTIASLTVGPCPSGVE